MKNKLYLVILAVILLSACGPKSSPTPAGTLPPIQVSSSGGIQEISISNFAFSPASVTLKVGTTVTWTNQDSAPHTIVSDTGEWRSPRLGQGDTFSFTFDKAGTFPYHCGVHSSMTGTITVEP